MRANFRWGDECKKYIIFDDEHFGMRTIGKPRRKVCLRDMSFEAERSMNLEHFD
jgi:hypothetical protein